MAPLGLELLALTAFVYARPVLASFGRSSETFVTRGADWTDVILFVVVVVVGPVAGLAVVDLAAAVAGPQWLRRVHAALVGVLGSLVAWQIGGQFTDLTFRSVAGPACGLVGVLLAVVRYRTQALGRFLRYASLIAVVVVVQFVFASASGGIVLGQRHVDVDPAVADAVSTAVGDDPPPVVLFVFDGLPTELLLDGQGAIDPELYPNLAELAGTSTWYRNNTTVAPVTMRAVPAILSGRLRDHDTPALAGSQPENVFTMLGASYDIHALEPLTGLCPVSLCPEAPGSPLELLLGDSRNVWKSQMGGRSELGFFVPGAFDDRGGRVEDFVDELDFEDDAPDAVVMHVLLPHDGWEYLDDGSPYTAMPSTTGMLAYNWGSIGADVGRQRHVLQTQYVDRIVGRVMDDLRRADRFDDAVVVVTADHGYAFDDETAVRGITEENYAEIMWTPLIVKGPGQTEGAVDDRNTQAVDVLPTIAHELGIDLPWQDLDGVPASEADRDPGDKAIDDWTYSPWRTDDGSPLAVDGEAGFAEVLTADPVAASGPLALWDRTGGAHGPLVGRDVDELPIGPPADWTLEVRSPELWDDVDADRPPIELVAFMDGPPGSTFAIAVDGTIAAVVPAVRGPYGLTTVHALLWPDTLSEGRNEIEAFVVEGTADMPSLRPVPVGSG